MMQSLPQDALERIVLFAAMDIRDIGRCAQVCRSLRNASSATHIWKTLAHAKYGEILAIVSEDLYMSDWKALMIDDNRMGAFPTLTTPIVCNWKFNSNIRSNRRHNRRHRQERHYCCIVQSVQWDRQERELRVHIDVRGETDLRHPMGSSITQLPVELSENRANNNVFTNIFGPDGRAQRSRLVPPPFDRWGMGMPPTRFVAEEEPTRRHFKGYLAFPTNCYLPPGNYSFCYANSNIRHGPDYMPVNLFTVSSQNGGLAEAFCVDHYLVRKSDPAALSNTGYSADESPFVDDTPEKERMRWEANVPPSVMNRGIEDEPPVRRHRGRFGGAWYV